MISTAPLPFVLGCWLSTVGALQVHPKGVIVNTSSFASGKASGAPCSCQANDPAWATCQRTQPKCIWIDLGAADGNSFNSFLQNYYGPVANCPNGQWEAMLVEANPRFDQALSKVASDWPGNMHMYSS